MVARVDTISRGVLSFLVSAALQQRPAGRNSWTDRAGGSWTGEGERIRIPATFRARSW